MKFSIIVPVYNVEKYVNKCLDSLINQTYQNYEIIVVCDKSTDKSEKIVDEYIKENKKIKKIFAENTGLAKAKNIGIKNAKGDYIMFLDGDDYYEEKLLETIKNNIEDGLDLLRFQAREIKDTIKIDYNEKGINLTTGINAFNDIIRYHYIENSWLYAYNRKFWNKNNFAFMEYCIAEDYGLTPLIIAKATKMKSINYIGYNYVQRDNSLMSNTDYKKRLKKMDDMLKQADYQKEQLTTIEGSNRIVEFINNSLIYYSTTLSYNDYKKYTKILKKKKCYEHLRGSNVKEKIKNIIIKTNAYFFFHYLAR